MHRLTRTITITGSDRCFCLVLIGEYTSWRDARVQPFGQSSAGFLHRKLHDFANSSNVVLANHLHGVTQMSSNSLPRSPIPASKLRFALEHLRLISVNRT